MEKDLARQQTNSSDGVRQDSEKAIEAEQIEQPTTTRTVTPRGGFVYKTKRHCARWWWVHLIIFCISFLIIALCLVYVAMPRIAQHDVNRSSLEVTDLEFLDPTPDTVVLTQKAILHSPSMYTPTLDSFSAASYVVINGTYGPEPMVHLPMPKIHALHPKSNASVVGAVVKIENIDQLTRYAIAILSDEYVTTALVGRTKLHEGKLPTTTINYNTTTTYKGLNGLANFNVTGARLNLSAPAGTPNLKGFAYIPNPSVMTVAMGNVTLTLSTASAGVVGNATINDMTLVPGNNTLPMTAIIDQPKVLSSMDQKTGIVELLIEGKDSIYNGQHITYYEKALASNVLKLQMNVQQVLKDSFGSS